MSNVLTEFGDDIFSLKTKFTEARRELVSEDVQTNRPKMLHHARSLAYAENPQMDRCE